MSQFVYSIYDLKGCCHDRVFCSVHDSDAVRLFDQLVFSQDSPYRNYCEDFVLCLIGSFDPSSGAIVSLPVKQLTTVMERQVFFEALQRIRQAKVDKTVCDHEVSNEVQNVQD